MSEYEKYQLQWMLAHGYSLRALIAELTEMQLSDPEDGDRISEYMLRHWWIFENYGKIFGFFSILFLESA